ncbi:MAG: 16S rRNA (adenine(1518)-N(6)/adenine(1519)-N(6))-dimethyltransferase RsmA [Proteobacteria bacterium]|nr:16S rRNA (adenine(1518)-N(6)/adenine(1519)-N(6))-dimethyltransferase RsmA [Pseudomonadota bacterium]
MSAAEIRALLRKYDLRLRRELGQNFLIDPKCADRLAELAGVEAGDTVIEVGTGLGILTRALAARAARVVSIEIDAGLVRALRAEAILPSPVELIHADAVTFDLRALIEAAGGTVRLVANLPFSAATPLLRRLLDLRDVLADWSVTVQREVAGRLLARSGTRDYSSLGVLHQLTADVRRALDLHPESFFPRPRVVSSFLRIVPRAGGPLRPGELEEVERVARAGFQQRRKTLRRALRGGCFGGKLEEAFRAAGIDGRSRAETVDPERWLAFSRALRGTE